MTLNLLFFTVTLQWRKQTEEEFTQQQTAKRFREENLLKVMETRDFM